jgi:hypothetical protein
MQIAMMSMFMNEGDDLQAKAEHVLSKASASEHVVRFIWVVAKLKNCEDTTLSRLAAIVTEYRDRTGEPCNVSIVSASSSIPHNAKSLAERLVRLSDHQRAALEMLRKTDDYMIIHECDLISPPDVIDRLVKLSEDRDGAVTAGWPVIKLPGVLGKYQFYDTWAYRRGGEMLSPHPPYCPGFTGEVFEVESVGSVWCSPASCYLETTTAWPYGSACVEMCDGLRILGRRIYVDPTLRIVQPFSRYQ